MMAVYAPGLRAIKIIRASLVECRRMPRKSLEVNDVSHSNVAAVTRLAMMHAPLSRVLMASKTIFSTMRASKISLRHSVASCSRYPIFTRARHHMKILSSISRMRLHAVKMHECSEFPAVERFGVERRRWLISCTAHRVLLKRLKTRMYQRSARSDQNFTTIFQHRVDWPVR